MELIHGMPSSHPPQLTGYQIQIRKLRTPLLVFVYFLFIFKLFFKIYLVYSPLLSSVSKTRFFCVIALAVLELDLQTRLA